MELFQCTPLNSKLTRHACSRRFAMTLKSGQGERYSASIRESRCAGCAIGKAHLDGKTPATWPDGKPIVVMGHESLPAAQTALVPLRTKTQTRRSEAAAREGKSSVRGPATTGGHGALRVATDPPATTHLKPPAREPKPREVPMPVEKLITHNGETLNLSAWARRLGVSSAALAARLASGWTEAETVTTAKGVTPPRVADARAESAKAPKGKPASQTAPTPRTSGPQAVDGLRAKVKNLEEQLEARTQATPTGPAAAPAPAGLLVALGYDVKDYPAVVAGGWHIIMWRAPA